MTLTLEMLLSLAGALVTLGGFWWGIARWVIAEFRQRDIAIRDEHVRAKEAEEELRKSLEAHRLYAAETFATAGDVRDAVKELKASVDGLTARLDKFLVEMSRDRAG